MPQVTLYLDDTTRDLMVKAARAEGISQSRWVTRLVRERLRPAWPQGWSEVLGSFPDFPLRATEPAVPDADRFGF